MLLVRNAIRRKRVKQATPPWVSDDVLEQIYMESYCLTNETRTQHDVHHIIPIQEYGEIVCGLHVPANLVIISRDIHTNLHRTVEVLKESWYWSKEDFITKQ